MSMRIGTGLDVHPFASAPRPLVLAGVEIPDAVGLEGHSDADVVAHVRGGERRVRREERRAQQREHPPVHGALGAASWMPDAHS